MKNSVDVCVFRNWTVSTLYPVSESAKEWFAENVCGEEWQRGDGGGVAVEHRYVDDIVVGLLAAGFSVKDPTLKRLAKAELKRRARLLLQQEAY